MLGANRVSKITINGVNGLHLFLAFIALLCFGECRIVNAAKSSDKFSYVFPVSDPFFGRKIGETEGTISLNVEVVDTNASDMRRCIVTLSSSSHLMKYSAVFLGFPSGSLEEVYSSETYLKKENRWVKEFGISEREEEKKWELLGTVTGLVDSYVGHFVDGLGEAVQWLRAEYKRDMRKKLSTWSVAKGTRVYGKYNMPGVSSRGWRNIRWVIPFRVKEEKDLFVAASCFAYSCDKDRLLQCTVPVAAEVLLSRDEIAKRIREWIEVIEEKEEQALPGIEEEERRRAEEKRKEEELEAQIAENCQKLNEEEDARVRRELEEARDRLTEQLLAMAYEHQQRRIEAASRLPPAQPQAEAWQSPPRPQGDRRPSSPPPTAQERGISDGVLTVKIWIVPGQLSASELWRRGRLDVTLYYAVSKDCDVEIHSQLNAGYHGDLRGAQLLYSEGGFSFYSSPGGGGVRWTPQPPTRIVAHRVTGGRTYTYDIGPIVIPPEVDRFVRSHPSQSSKPGERIPIKCDGTFTIKASDGRRTVSNSVTWGVVP